MFDFAGCESTEIRAIDRIQTLDTSEPDALRVAYDPENLVVVKAIPIGAETFP